MAHMSNTTDEKQPVNDTLMSTMSAVATTSNAYKPSFQTASRQGLSFFSTFVDAYRSVLNDPTIWKISFHAYASQLKHQEQFAYKSPFHSSCDAWFSFRWVVKYKTPDSKWSKSLERHMCRLSPTYSAEPYSKDSTAVFWVHQRMLGPNYDKISADNTLDLNKKNKQHALDAVVEVLTDEEFFQRFAHL